MTFYLSIVLIMCLIALFEISGKVSYGLSKAVLIVFCMLTWAVSFLRWETGTDWWGYHNYFLSLNNFSDAMLQSWWEPGYSFTAVVFNNIGFHYSAFLFAVASLAFAVKMKLVEFVYLPVVFVYVLFCLNFNDMFFVRQNISAIMIGAAVLYLYSGRNQLFLFFGFLACMFHTAAAVVLFLAFAIKISEIVRGKKLILAITGLFVVAVVMVRYIELYKYYEYLTVKTVETSKEDTQFRGVLKSLYWIAVFLWMRFILHLRRKVLSTHEFSLYKNCIGLALLISLLSGVGVFFSEVLSRLPLYLYPIYAFLLSSRVWLLRSNKNNAALGFVYASILLSLILNFYVMFSAFEDSYFPIKFIF